jgi:hypothetical protein
VMVWRIVQIFVPVVPTSVMQASFLRSIDDSLQGRDPSSDNVRHS